MLMELGSGSKRYVTNICCSKMLDHSNRPRALVLGKCTGHLWRPIIVASSIDVQVTGEALAAKSHNQVMQNVARKILFNN